MGVDRGASDLIADEENEGFQQVGQTAFGGNPRFEHPCQAGEHEVEDDREDHLQNHVLRDPEAADGVEALEARKGLRDQDLPAHRLVKRVDAGHRLASLLKGLAEPFRHFFKRLPVALPEQLGNLKEVGIFEVIDRIVVGHGNRGRGVRCERDGVDGGSHAEVRQACIPKVRSAGAESVGYAGECVKSSLCRCRLNVALGFRRCAIQ